MFNLFKIFQRKIEKKMEDKDNKFWKNLSKKVEKHTRGSMFITLCIGLLLYKNSCSKKNWDGYNAKPVSEKSIGHILEFLKKFKKTKFPFPELSPLPNGRMGMEWNKGENSILLSASKTGIIYWTSLIGNKSDGEKFQLRKKSRISKKFINKLGELYEGSYN